MTSFSDLQSAEPAFMAKNSNKQASKLRSSQVVGPRKNLHDCCFSLSNLALIVAAIVALIFSVRFLYDEVLYEHGEHLLSLRFYRQIIYIIVILPLILLVPLFNTISALCLSDSLRYELGNSLLTVKLFYQIIMAIMVFVALAFVAPFIRQSSVATQLAYELRRHMTRRYDNDFSYEFMDQIQMEYKCCDELWYRANYNDKLPLSCFVPDGQYKFIYDEDCADVIGSFVANRCVVLAICLLILLVALFSLIGIDLMELLTRSRNEYDVSHHETKLQSRATSSLDRSRGNSQRRSSLDSTDDDDHNNNEDDTSLTSDRERQTLRASPSGSRLSSRANFGESRATNLPLLTKEQQLRSQQEEEVDEESGDFNPMHWTQQRQRPFKGTPEPQRQTTPILTRANYVNHYSHRPLSPVFVGTSMGGRSINDDSNESSSLKRDFSPDSLHLNTPKSVLKKSSSFQRINTSSQLDNEQVEEEEEQDEVQDYHRQLQRELQTRRSLLNVRFAE